MKKVLVFILAVTLILSMAACTQTESPAQPAPDAAPNGDSSNQTNATATPEPTGGVVKIGIIGARTGTSVLYGDMTIHAAEAAADAINAAGGILGNTIEFVIEDEGSDLQSSVNATQKLIDENKDLLAILGSQYSTRILSTIDVINEGAVPLFTFGSNATLLEQNCEWLWMMRVADSYTGVGIHQVASDYLKCSNPAFIYSTNAFGQGLYDVVSKQFTDAGVTLNPRLAFGVGETEVNFTNQLTQIANSDADCLIALGTDIAPYVVKQAYAAGITIPRIGSMSFANQTTFTQCTEEETNGWYSVCEWSTDVKHAESQAYMDYVMNTYGSLDTTGQPGAYDAMWVLKAACEAAGTVTDHAAINKAIGETNGIVGASGTLAAYGTQCLCTELVITQNEGSAAKVQSRISVRTAG
ncbi:MAG: ABC transporter substrate-binding protein [Christensenellaceae bacterium]|jgi:branched-chain amino acid transport system substrate-binding protein|nr:ABC transporter substrate-binding protein [Christensenellaceae bacterium]